MPPPDRQRATEFNPWSSRYRGAPVLSATFLAASSPWIAAASSRRASSGPNAAIVCPLVWRHRSLAAVASQDFDRLRIARRYFGALHKTSAIARDNFALSLPSLAGFLSQTLTSLAAAAMTCRAGLPSPRPSRQGSAPCRPAMPTERAPEWQEWIAWSNPLSESAAKLPHPHGQRNPERKRSRVAGAQPDCRGTTRMRQRLPKLVWRVWQTGCRNTSG